MPSLNSNTLFGVAVAITLVLLASVFMLLYISLTNDPEEPLVTFDRGFEGSDEWICPGSYGRLGCLKVFSEKRSWDLAEQSCLDEQQQDAHLVSIDGFKQQEFIKEMLRDRRKRLEKSKEAGRCRYYWVGAEWDPTSKQFQWINGGGIARLDGLEASENRSMSAADGLAIDGKSLGLVARRKEKDNCFICLWNAKESIKDAEDCRDLSRAGKKRRGLYKVHLKREGKAAEEAKVLCEMGSSSGGWTIFQQRVDGQTIFWNRTWKEYRNGFGLLGLSSEFWMGNELLHRLSTNHPNVSLRVELWGDRNPHSDLYTDDYLESEYSGFSVGNESTDYTLSASVSWPGYGNASGGWYDITFSSGNKFSTVDRINDPNPACVTDYHLGGWWLHFCSFSALNGEYRPPIAWANGYGMMWLTHGIYIINPRKTRMMLRKND